MDWLLPSEYTGSPAVYMLVTLSAFVLTGVSKGGFGGVGALAVPLLLMVISPALALGMWLPLLVLCDIFTIGRYPKQWKLKPILLMAPWVLAGIVVGYTLLGKLNPAVLKVFVGALSVGFVSLEWLRSWVARRLSNRDQDKAWQPNFMTAAPFGFAAGVSTMVAHAAGAFTTIYFLLQRMDKRTFVGTAGRFYFVFNSVKVPFLVKLGYINRESLTISLWLIPLAPLTVWAGSALNKRIDPVAFNKIIYLLLALTGGYLIYANV